MSGKRLESIGSDGDAEVAFKTASPKRTSGASVRPTSRPTSNCGTSAPFSDFSTTNPFGSDAPTSTAASSSSIAPSFDPGWRWGSTTSSDSNSAWSAFSPRPTLTNDPKSSFHHVRMQSSNFHSDDPTSSLGAGLLGMRRSSLVERAPSTHGDLPALSNDPISIDPLRQRAVNRHGLHLRPPPGMDKLEDCLQMVALTNRGWSFGLSIVLADQGLVTLCGQQWIDYPAITHNQAFRKCCQSSEYAFSLSSAPPPPTRSPRGSASSTSLRHRASMQSLEQSHRKDSSHSSDAHESSVAMAAVRAVSLPPAPGKTPVVVGMLHGFAFRGQGQTQDPSNFVQIVERLGRLVVSALERSAHSFRRERELLAQQSLVSMKRYISGEMPESTLSDESSCLGLSIFSQAATSIKAVLGAHSCAVWDISCFRLLQCDGSGSSQKSESEEVDTLESWRSNTTIGPVGLDSTNTIRPFGAPESMIETAVSRRGSLACFSSLPSPSDNPPQMPGIHRTDSSVAASRQPSFQDPVSDAADEASEGALWTCSYPVTSQAVGLIGFSGADRHHFDELDGLRSRPVLAEFLATTKDLGFHSQAQAQGEHFRTTESSVFGEAPSLSGLLPPGCEGLLAVPIFEIDQQPAFMIFVSFTDKPVLEDSDRHFVEQVGDILLSSSIRSRVKAVDRAQTHFIQKIQHELRTPLHAVIGTLDALRDAVATNELEDAAKLKLLSEAIEDESTAERKVTLQDAAKRAKDLASLIQSASISADALNDMINNVLDFGALKAMPSQSQDRRDLAEVSFDDICSTVADSCLTEWCNAHRMDDFYNPSNEREDEDLVDPLSCTAAKPRIELFFDFDRVESHGSYVTLIDLEPIKTTVRKLVNNAIRATSSGHIIVGLKLTGERPVRSGNDHTYSRSASRLRRRGSTERLFDIDLTVKDTGKGMSKDFINTHLFAPYAKEDTFLPGSGLSLAIASRLIHRLGGHVQVDSQPDVGTTFTVKIPARFAEKRTSHRCGTRQLCTSDRGLAFFAGFETSNSQVLKHILLSRLRIAETKTLEDCSMVFVREESLRSGALDDSLTYLSTRLRDGLACPNIVILKRSQELDGRPSSPDAGYDEIIKARDPSLLDRVHRIQRPIITENLKSLLALIDPETSTYSRNRSVSTASSVAPFADCKTSFPSQLDMLTPTSLDDTVAPSYLTSSSRSTQSDIRSDSPLTPALADTKCFPSSDAAVPGSAQPEEELDAQKVSKTMADDDSSKANRELLGVEPATLKQVEEAANDLSTPEDFIVMVVEDNPLNMRIMTTMLDRAGIKYVQAWNGQEAVELFKVHLPQVVLLDITMPIMDGYQACVEIRKIRPASVIREDGSPRHRIIAVTALSSEADRLRGREAGMDDWLKKPLKMSSLMNDLKAWKAQVVTAV